MQKLFNCILLAALAISCATLVSVSRVAELAPSNGAMRIEYRLAGVDGPWTEIPANHSEYWHEVEVRPTTGGVKAAPIECRGDGADISASCILRGAMMLEIPTDSGDVMVEYRITLIKEKEG